MASWRNLTYWVGEEETHGLGGILQMHAGHLFGSEGAPKMHSFRGTLAGVEVV